MQPTSMAKHYTNPLLSLAAIIIILAGVSYAESIISPLLIALFISALSGPVMFWLTAKKVPSGIAVSLIIACIVILGFFISSILGSSVHGFSENLPEYQKRLQEITHSIGVRLGSFGIKIQLEELKNIFNLGKAMGLISTTLNQLLGALSNIFFILMTVIFLLLELSSFRFKIKAISADPEQTMDHLYHVSKTVADYFKIKSLTSFLTALAVFIALTFMDIDFPILWALLAFLFNFIPNIGSIIAAVPVILLALIQFGFLVAGEVIILYVVINSVVGNFLEPKFMGKSLGLSTLIVFLSLIFWGWLLGPVGMFLSVPLTMTFKIIMDNSENTHWISVLLSNNDQEIH